jgi:hypothetical protein
VALWVLCLASAVPGATQAQRSLQPLSLEEQRTLSAKVLADERVVAFAKGQRVRVLRVVLEQVVKADGTPAVATAVVVNYGTGEAVRARITPETGRVTAIDPLKGHPQSSAEEREEAREIIRKDAEIAPLMAAGTRLEGGFVVDPPQGQPAQGRYLEFHVVSSDGQSFIAEVVVDLSRNQVAARRREEPGRKDGAA